MIAAGATNGWDALCFISLMMLLAFGMWGLTKL